MKIKHKSTGLEFDNLSEIKLFVLNGKQKHFGISYNISDYIHNELNGRPSIYPIDNNNFPEGLYCSESDINKNDDFPELYYGIIFISDEKVFLIQEQYIHGCDEDGIFPVIPIILDVTSNFNILK